MRLDSAQKGRVKVSLPDIHNAWFALGHVPVIPFLEVSAELDVDTRTLEISQLRAAVHTPGGLPERETYVLQFGQFRTVQGRLIPGLVQYSIAGLSHSMNDRSMEFVQQGSHSNRAYRDSIVRKVENLERSGQKELASKYKRAAVRVRSLKAQIADEVVTSGKPFEVKLLKVVEGNQKAKKKP